MDEVYVLSSDEEEDAEVPSCSGMSSSPAGAVSRG